MFLQPTLIVLFANIGVAPKQIEPEACDDDDAEQDISRQLVVGEEIEDRKQSCLDMIGVRVHYYDGDGIGGTPSAATVVKALMNGCVDLRVLHPGGGEGMDKKAVRHISDPRLKVNEHFRKTGCWDYTWYEKYPEKFKQVVKETCSTND